MTHSTNSGQVGLLRPSTLCDPMDTFHPSYLDEIVNALRGPALQDVVDMRLEQIVKHGHDAEHDGMLALDQLPRMARDFGLHAIEQITATGEKRNLRVARKNLVRMAATALAAIDRLDAATGGKDLLP